MFFACKYCVLLCFSCCYKHCKYCVFVRVRSIVPASSICEALNILEITAFVFEHADKTANAAYFTCNYCVSFHVSYCLMLQTAMFRVFEHKTLQVLRFLTFASTATHYMSFVSSTFLCLQGVMGWGFGWVSGWVGRWGDISKLCPIRVEHFFEQSWCAWICTRVKH